MLKQRIATAIVLLAVFLPALFAASPRPFMVVTAVLIGAAGWEWGRLVGMGGAVAWITALLCVGLCFILDLAGFTERPLPLLWSIVVVAWVFAGGWILARGVAEWARLARLLRWFVGVVALCVAWLAIARARTVGINFLLSALVLVWAADICAYFAGRAFGGRFTGGRKLAPTISPGKTWEGVAGAVLGVWVSAALWIWADRVFVPQAPSLYTRLFDRGLFFLIFGAAALVGVSVMGDLFESLVKRAAGVKDSSRLLPGHGGVLDRVDAILPALPAALALAALSAAV